MNRKTSFVLICALLLFLAFGPAGCGQSAEAVAAHDVVVSYLEDAKDDFTPLQAMVNDPDMDPGDDSDDNLEGDAMVQKAKSMLTKIDDYKSKIGKRIELAQKRDTLKNDELADFAKSELRCLQLSSEILDEYKQIIDYMLLLIDMGAEMEAIGQLDFTDMQNLEANYKAFSDAVAKAVEVLKTAEVPSFLKSVNDGLIDVFLELQDAVTYVLNAMIMNDPLRSDAGAYRIALLMRKVESVTTEANADVDRRLEKLKQDIEAVKKLNSGLADWIDNNLNALGAS